MKRDRPSTAAAATTATPDSDLFRMLLPNAHTHIPKGKARMWDSHFQQQQVQIQQHQQPSKPATPSRPHTSRGRGSNRTQLPLSPRYVLTPPSPRPNIPRPVNYDTPAKSSSPRVPSRVHDPTVGPSDDWTLPPSEYAHEQPDAAELPLDVNARGHVEMKACMLAYMHRIDVDTLQQVRDKAMHEIGAIKAKQILARGGVLDDGSLLETTKRKTSFLLRHFFALGDTDTSALLSKQEVLMHDVIDEWVCREHATSDEVANLWKSITKHIEHSYVLRRHLVAKADPDPLSIAIALDCLRKLPTKLPDYRRMLDVIIALIDRGLHCSYSSEDAVSDPLTRRRFYFEKCQHLREALEREAEERRARLAAEAQNGVNRSKTPLQQIRALLATVNAEIATGQVQQQEREALFTAVFQSNADALIQTAILESLRYCYDKDVGRDVARRYLLDTMVPLLVEADARYLLTQLTDHQLGAFQSFFRESFDAMDKLLMGNEPAGVPQATSTGEPPTSSSSTATPTALFRELIERHPSEFAAVLWGSPYLTAHVFQESHHMIARVLEQNIVLISQALHQRPDVLLTLFNHTLCDNTAVMEEFLLSHPKVFSDVLLNRPAAVAAAVKAHPSILADLLQASHLTLACVLQSMPELLCHLFKSSPELLAQTIREDLTILPLAFSIVPQSLSDALERHPEYFVDVAHRKPTLVSKLFAKHPDLLLEPLEANPSVFSNFLVYHRRILPDFSDPNFDPTFFQFERKQFVDSSQQTEKRRCKYDGRLRLREKIKFQEEALACAIRQTNTSVTGGRNSVVSGRGTPVAGGSTSGRMTPGADRNASAVSTLSPGQVISEIARVYVKKIEANDADDSMGRRRQALTDFVLDLYVQELGFKGKAQKKIALFLAGAKHGEQESLRIKWFLRFMNAATAPPSTATVHPHESAWSFHPMAVEFYLAALRFLVAVPVNQLFPKLDEELLRPCLVGYARVKQLLEDPLLARILKTKEQRQHLLASICEKENTIHGGSQTSEVSFRASSATVTMLHLEDVLEMVVFVWVQHQDTIRSEWTRQFQLVNPDGSGVIRFNMFADLIHSKMPALDNRAMMKIYRQCEEENDLGEVFLAVDDFSLAMSILQEQAVLRQLAPSLTMSVSATTT